MLAKVSPRAYRRRLSVTKTVTGNVHFSSQTDLWATPQWLYDKLDTEFNFTVDVCATPENAKCERFYTKSENGLAQTWTGVCWCNPPFGRQIGLWLAKAREAALSGATVVALIPARTDTKWWHGIVMAASVLGAIKSLAPLTPERLHNFGEKVELQNSKSKTRLKYVGHVMGAAKIGKHLLYMIAFVIIILHQGASLEIVAALTL